MRLVTQLYVRCMKDIINSIMRLLIVWVPTSFDYKGSIDEGIEVLSRHVANYSNVLNIPCDDSLVGTVTPSKVRIYQYYGPYRGRYYSSSQINFIGRFIQDSGKTKLVGVFKLHQAMKNVYILVIIGMFLFWIGIMIRDINESSSMSDFAILIIAPFITVLFFMVFFNFMYDKKYIKSEVKDLKEKISNILQTSNHALQ